MTAAVDVRRADERFVTKLDWLNSRHSFSFGSHYDPTNTHHGVLLANNDDQVSAGRGFDPHPHRDMEIVTWVLSGSLVHQDSEGNSGVIYPGLAQRISAGSGIVHSEKNDAGRTLGRPTRDESMGGETAHFVQMWVAPDETAIAPSYEQREIAAADLDGRLWPVASGLARHAGDAAIRIHNRSAGLLAARLPTGATVQLPDAPYLHVFVPVGAVAAEAVGALSSGDALRLRGGGQRITALEPAELLVWEMHTDGST